MKAFGHSTQINEFGDTVNRVTYYWQFNGEKVHAYCVSNTPYDASLPHRSSVSVHVEHELVKILELDIDSTDSREYIKGVVEKWLRRYH
jgi:hypothetical protein